MKDSDVATIFELAKKERVLQTVLYNVDTDQWTRSQFIAFLRDRSRIVWLVMFDNKLAGLVWLDDFQQGARTARIHFCFFRWLIKAQLTIQVGRELLWVLLNTKFNNGPLSVIRGETPAFNKLAVRFIEKVGLTVVGEMPHAAYRYEDRMAHPMVLSFVTRDILREKLAVPTSEDAPALSTAQPTDIEDLQVSNY